MDRGGGAPAAVYSSIVDVVGVKELCDMEIEEVVRRLRVLQHLKVGDPFPDWMSQNWGPTLSELCGHAADLIEEAGAGAARAAGEQIASFYIENKFDEIKLIIGQLMANDSAIVSAMAAESSSDTRAEWLRRLSDSIQARAQEMLEVVRQRMKS